MRRALVLVWVVALVVLMIPAGPAVAGKPGPVGDQINVLAGTPTTFDAGTPFHVIHGFGVAPSDGYPPGRYSFSLDFDGVDQGRGTFVGGGSEGFARLFLFNFEEVASVGNHNLTGHWFAPCLAAVDLFGYPGPCPNPNEPIEVLTIDLVVTFS